MNDISWTEQIVKMIAPTETALIVKVNAEEHSRKTFCFQNVREKIERDGGESVNGWEIYETKNMIEAEFHCVWRSRDGELVDVTPNEKDEILFVVDSKTEYNGKRCDNIRLNKTSNMLVHHLILVSEAIYRITKFGETDDEERISLPRNVYVALQYLELMRLNILKLLRMDGTGNSDCYCGSGKEYKKCHGDDLEINLKRKF